MKNDHFTKHKLNTADAVTFLRIAGTLLLVFLRPLSMGFFWGYALTGLTDVLDGWIARKTITASDFGARLDSIADLLFYSVMLLRVFPILWNTLPMDIWYAVAVILILRISAYGIAAVKYRRFASLHTYLNRITGGAVFLIPFLLVTEYAAVYCRITCAIAAAAALEELVIHLLLRTYHTNTKSICIMLIYKERRNTEHENSCFERKPQKGEQRYPTYHPRLPGRDAGSGAPGNSADPCH